jgi:hypothetical protein
VPEEPEDQTSGWAVPDVREEAVVAGALVRQDLGLGEQRPSVSGH